MFARTGRIGLKWKIGGIYTGVMLILAILLVAAIYQVTRNTLRAQLDKRAMAIATNFSDAAAGHIAAKNLLALHVVASKYALLDGVAYSFIENNRGEIIAQTLGTFPSELRQGFPIAGRRQIHRRELSLRGRPVYEFGLPVLDGQAGSVYLGFWVDAVQQEIQSALLPLLGIVALVPLVGALLSFLVAHWIVRPIVGLTQVADKVTKGDLEISVTGACVTSHDEIGDLARSLERMRASLKAAMLRLTRETA